MRRHLIGILGIVLSLGAAAFWIWQPTEAWSQQLHAACQRMGPMLIILWVAYKEVSRLPAWLLGTFPVLLILLAVKPRLFLFLIPLVIALAILQPRFGRKRGR